MHGADRVESKISWLAQFRPIRFIKRGEDLIHAVWILKIGDAFAAVKNLKRRIMSAVGIGIEYFHSKTILPASVNEGRGKSKNGIIRSDQ